jgi:hypothetical protein
MPGIFDLETSQELYGKLKRDFAAFEQDQLNSDLAFNLFVTAWHLLEWTYPNDSSKQKQIRDSNAVLQVCEHLAVGAKHFNATNKKHQSVKQSGFSGGAWASGVWAKGSWAPGVWGEKLSITLENDAATQLGNSISAIDLAKNVMDFWEKREHEFT